MISMLQDTKVQLQEQLEDIVKKIQSLETELMVNKEGFLKVQGALEILNVLEERRSAEDAQLDQATNED